MWLYLVIAFVTYVSWMLYWNLTDALPGPPLYLPLFANALQLGVNPLHYLKNLVRWAKDYDRRIFRLWLAGDYHAILSNPKDIEVILSSTEVLNKRGIYEFLRPWLGDGLLTSDSFKWHSHRKMITPSFHFQILKEFLGTMNRTSTKFVKKLRIISKDKKIMDIQEVVHKCTLDIICETAFGVEMNSLDDENQEIVTCINDLCFILTERMYSAVKRFQILYIFFPVYYKLKKQLNVFQTYMHKIITERRAGLPKEFDNAESTNAYYSKRKLAFLDNLLTARIDDKPLSYQDILDEVSTFLFEGHDTTASAVSFMFYTLSRHPHVQEKLYDEQMSLSDDPNWEPSYEEIQEMKYLEMTIKECLRLFPSVPGIGRQTTVPMEINGQYIPAKTILILLIMSMGYNEEYFDKPCEFIPERFLPDNRTGANPFDHVSFSAGPRNCIGQKFAMMEVKAIMCKIVRHFRILPPVDDLKTNGIFDMSTSMKNKGRTKWDATMSAVLTLKSVQGIHVRLEER
ncbi:hypothetical protein ACFFRR_007426 [Megaselia abdita]